MLGRSGGVFPLCVPPCIVSEARAELGRSYVIYSSELCDA